jgi:dTDP-4-amino-4,6-dideoxygalactose transaminase
MKKLIKLKNRIPYGKHFIDKKDNSSVLKALNSEVISNGPTLNFFENKTKNYLGCKFSLACSSGTAALHLSFLSLDLKKNDIVILPVINFIAAANILSLMNVKFVFADVDRDTGQISKETILKCIDKNKIKKIKAVVTNYLGGNIYNYEDILALKKKYKFLLIEDACHAFGSKYKLYGKYYNVGCAKHSDISTFSFHPLKTITTGEGGLITTNNIDIYNKIKILRSHGFNYKKKYWFYDLKCIGLNYRMSDINAALGLSQLKKINFFLKRRFLVAKKYNNSLKNIKYIKLPELQKYSSWHLYVIQIDFKKIGISRDFLIKKLNILNIFPQIHYMPSVEFKKFYNSNKNQIQNAIHYYKT